MANFPEIIELNVGGVFYTTSLGTITQQQESSSKKDSLLSRWFNGEADPLPNDKKGRYFIDRDGILFRYVLDYLRDKSTLVLPESFREKERLIREANYYGLPKMVELLKNQDPKKGYITVGYRGSFAFGKDVLSDVKFRKITRILVCGRVTLCREVFGATLNESRDPDHGESDRYTARFYLKHSSIEQAFDMLLEQGFSLASSCASGTAGGFSASDLKPGVDMEESRWNHYNEFIFYKD